MFFQIFFLAISFSNAMVNGLKVGCVNEHAHSHHVVGTQADSAKCYCKTCELEMLVHDLHAFDGIL